MGDATVLAANRRRRRLRVLDAMRKRKVFKMETDTEDCWEGFRARESGGGNATGERCRERDDCEDVRRRRKRGRANEDDYKYDHRNDECE